MSSSINTYHTLDGKVAVHKVIGDGNCLFRSIAESLSDSPLPSQAEATQAREMRIRLIELMKTTAYQTLPSMEMTVQEAIMQLGLWSSYDKYLRELESGLHPGVVELLVLSVAMNFNYKVYRQSNVVSLAIIEEMVHDEEYAMVEVVWSPGELGDAGNHFDYIRRKRVKVSKQKASKKGSKPGSVVSNTFSTLASSSSESGSGSEQSGSDKTDHSDDTAARVAGFMAGLESLNLDEIDELVDSLDLADVTKSFADFGDEITTGMLDAIGMTKAEEFDRIEHSRRETPFGGMTVGQRKIDGDMPECNLDIGPYFLVSLDGMLYLSTSSGFFVCGTSKIDLMNIPINYRDPVRMASDLNESTTTKGTGLGFSSFVHSIAICAIADGNSVIEPVAGYDLILRGFSVEMTGFNYARRETRAQFVINKYAIMSHLVEDTLDLKFIMKTSVCEDRAIPTMFFGSGLDSGITHYSVETRKQAEHLMLMSDSNYINLGQMFKSWVSRQAKVAGPSPPGFMNTNSIDRVVAKFGKDVEGVMKYPAPLRVLPGKEFDPATFNPRDYVVQSPTQTPFEGKTTFHNYNLSDDPESDLLLPCEGSCGSPFETTSRTMQWLHSKLQDYSIYSSIWVESELMAKIGGNAGYFYSMHSFTGITWRKTSSSSLTWYVSYYRIGKPPRSCGDWGVIDKDIDLWQSPCFKASVNDINHCRVLSHRCLSMIAGLLAYTKDRERPTIIQKVLLLTAMSRGSSWHSSVLAGNFRFLVLNMLSRTGNPQSQIDAIEVVMSKPLTSCDYLIVRAIRSSVSRFNSRAQETPLVGLPFRFINIEKDFALTTMWHMRKINDPIETVRKLLVAASEEARDRESSLSYMELVTQYTLRASVGELTQFEFDFLIEVKPVQPHFNPLVFAGMCAIATKGGDFGARQKTADVRMSTLVSDKRCIKATFPSVHGADGCEFKSVRVADAFATFFCQHGDPQSIFHLISRMASAPPVPSVNNCVEKGSKSGRREIPQMNQDNRVKQMYSEKNLSIFVDQEESDFMTDSKKFATFSEDAVRILRSGGLLSSEDKSGFCHNFLPESMGLAMYALGRMIGSTGMISSSAMMMCDSVRYTVLPEGTRHEDIPPGVEKLRAKGIVGKKIVELIMTANYKNFQQGQRAYAGACINTIFTKAFDMVLVESCSLITDTTIRTTSDDLQRGVTVEDDGIHDTNAIEQDYLHLPIKYNSMCMMVNNSKKYMESRFFAEFNNVTCGPNGLFNSSLTNANLAIQPLIGDNPMDDLISVVSMARSTLQWGTSLDVIRSCYYSNLVQFQQKWLFSRDDIDYFVDIGLLPRSDEELIEGFCIRTKETRARVAQLLTEEQADMVISGDLELVSALRSFRVRDSKPKKMRAVDYVSKVPGLLKTFKRINASRRVMGRMSSAIARPLPVVKRKAVSNGFKKLLGTPAESLTEKARMVADTILEPYPVRILPMYPQAKHLMPFKMGDSRTHSDMVSLAKVRVWRLTGLILTEPLTSSEEEVCRLSEEDFVKAEFKLECEQKRFGASWVSPAGCSLMRFHNDVLYKTPVAFTYRVDLPLERWAPKPIEVNQMTYVDFEPTHLSGSMIEMSIKNRYKIPFGTAYNAGRKYAFVMSSNNVIRTVLVADVFSKQTMCRHQSIRGFVIVNNQPNFSPIPAHTFDTVERPWLNNALAGDATALLNYGNYLNTRSPGAALLRSKLFAMVDCKEPSWSHGRLHEYPYHPPNSKVVEGVNYNYFVGSRLSCLIELKFGDNKVGKQVIKLDGKTIHVEAGMIPSFETQDEDLWADML